MKNLSQLKLAVMLKLLVVGAGFAGAALSRTLAEGGHHVTVLEKRNHIGGNAFDYINEIGERIHKYGPHLLHGNADSKAVRWMTKFTDWEPYEHRVRALLPDGRSTPLPVNRTTLEDVFGIHLPSDTDALLFLKNIQLDISHPTNSDEVFLASVGEELSNLFFRPYTKKMWGLDPSQLSTNVGSRLPVRTNRDDRYFTDSFQALPRHGYSVMFERIFDHPNITLFLDTEFKHEYETFYDHCFLAVPIDMYFDYAHGPLPYRSIQFKNQLTFFNQPSSVINFTDNGPYTRSTQWNLFPNSSGNSRKSTVTLETPCDIKDNPGEYYYPVQTKSNQEIYRKYQLMAKNRSNITFCGRTGLFRYIDMIPAVTLHLDMADKFLALHQCL